MNKTHSSFQLSKDHDSFYYLDEFLAYFSAVKERSELTVKEYYYDLALFFRWWKWVQGKAEGAETIEDIRISDITLTDLSSISLSVFYRFLAWLANERNVGPAGRARSVSSLRSFFGYLTNKLHVLDINPASDLESPKKMQSLPRYLDVDEARALLAAAASADDANASRDYCMLTLFVTCGLRLSELVGIDLRDIEGDTLRVVGKGNKERTIFLNHLAREAIEKYLPDRHLGKAQDQEALFISRNRNRISQRAVENVVKKYLALAGLDPDRYSAHKLRHTAATLMYQYGDADLRSLQQILGHSSVSTTEIYTHVTSRMLQDTVEQHPLNHYDKESFQALGEELFHRDETTEQSVESE